MQGPINIQSNTTQYIATGTTITLPPGTYAVIIAMLMQPWYGSAPDTAFWLRTSFANTNTGVLAPSPDIVRSTFASGCLVGPGPFSTLSGTIIIKNASSSQKTYYYIAGNVRTVGSAITLYNFGGGYWNEDNIIAIRLQ